MKTLALNEADLHLLPPSMQWLAKAIGLRATLLLVVRHGGGTPVYVPLKVLPDHPLLHLVGAEAFAGLVAEYGGEAIEIARCERAARALLYRQIRRESAEGHTQNGLALKHCFTVRNIRNILDGGEGPENESQATLF